MSKQTADEIFRKHGIVGPTEPGQFNTICPKCSHARKAGHQKLKCLGVKVDDLGVQWHCNHCEWSGGEFFERRSSSRFVAEYIYRQPDGTPYLRVCKTSDKGFPQFHWDVNQWVAGKPKGPKIPYRLPELVAAAVGTVCYVAEGEKDCDSLARIGLVATSASEGAGKWKADLNQWFKDRRVVILVDADAPGRAHGQQIAKQLHRVAASVKVVDLYPERIDGSDVSDWLTHHSREDLDALIATAASAQEEQAGDGAALLDDVSEFLGRFIAYPSEHAQMAHVLWIAHAHAMEAWESTPRIAFLSPEPASGKTRSMEVTELIVPNPVAAVNVTPAYLFRKVGSEDGLPTILFDEIDTVFGPKAKENEEVRALLNSGHRRGAVAGRCVVRGKTVETEEIPSYSAVALAGLGWLPDTILSRSIIIRMRRRAPDESIKPFRRRIEAPVGEALQRRLAKWAGAILDSLTEARPQMPASVEDRNADVWEPLLAIADAAGGTWPECARKAAVALVEVTREVEPSLNIRLLADLRTVFKAEEQLTTKKILAELYLLEDAPWNDIKGKPLSDNQLGRRLKQYGVKSKTLRFPNDRFAKGYARTDLYDVWRRYLPPISEKPVTDVTPDTTQFYQGVSEDVETSQASNGTSHEPSQAAGNVTSVTAPVTPCDGSADERNAHKTRGVTPVTAVTPLQDNGGERQISTSPEDRHPRGEHVCAQCNGPEDGKEQPVEVGGKTVWLHPECERFYRKATTASAPPAPPPSTAPSPDPWEEAGKIPAFLDRRSNGGGRTW
jgi:5S rRNA maturation endonuclease (ribonuclease M5)